MRKLTALSLLLTLLCASAFATTNVLVLTWQQPSGFNSTLYQSENLGGEWTSLGVVTPLVGVIPTNPVVYFTVMVFPTNVVNGGTLFVSNPNSEGLRPANTNAPDYAYSINPAMPTWLWNPFTQQWQ